MRSHPPLCQEPKKTGKSPECLRRFWLRMAAVLLVLLVLGSAFVISSHEEIEQWEYPRKYSDLVEYYAGKYSLDEKMLYAVIRTESNFDPNAQSSVDARGLMQITEITFDWIKSNIAPGEELTFDDLYDPETNIRFGSYFFSYCLQRYGNDLATAAAAYHSGWGNRGRTAAGQPVHRRRRHPDPVPLQPDEPLCQQGDKRLSAVLRDLRQLTHRAGCLDTLCRFAPAGNRKRIAEKGL